MNKPKYIMRRIVIDKKSIKDFLVNEEERRQIKLGRVASLRILLEKGEHFDSPLVCNWREDKKKWTIIDGNHRLEAMKECIVKNPDFEVEVWVAEYNNLSQKDILTIREQEREIYSTWNKGNPETATDYLQQHFKTIPTGELMLKLLPVSVYGSEKLLPITKLVGNYATCKKQNKFNGSYGNGGEKCVSDFMKIESSDIKLIRAFYLDMIEVFGEYRKGMLFYKGNGIAVLMRIWYDNRMRMPREALIRLFKTTFAQRMFEWENLLRSTGREGTNMLYRSAILNLNDKSSKYQFLSDLDIMKTKGKQPLFSLEDEPEIETEE